MLAVTTICLVQTLKALSSSCVAISRSTQVDIVVAIAFLAGSARFIGIAEKVVVADITLGSSVAGLTIANDVIAAGN